MTIKRILVAGIAALLTISPTVAVAQSLPPPDQRAWKVEATSYAFITYYCSGRVETTYAVVPPQYQGVYYNMPEICSY